MEPTINFDLTQINQMLDEYPRGEQRFRENTLDAIGNRLINLIREKAPKSSGSYARSWKMEKAGDSRKITTKQKDLYIILEFRGAEPHDIERKQAKALHFFDENGEEKFFVKVSVDGFDNIPHVRPAIKQLNRDIRTIVYVSAGVHFVKLLGRATKIHRNTFKNMGGSISGNGIQIKLRSVKVTR